MLAAAEQAAAARDAGAAFQVLAPDDAVDLAAIAAQIFPTDALPGANEAGVVYFMESALCTFMAGARESVLAGLQGLNAKAAALQLGARFAGLPAQEQTRLLKAEETSPFFGTVSFLTVGGMFALPVYGGNRGPRGLEAARLRASPFLAAAVRTCARRARRDRVHCRALM